MGFRAYLIAAAALAPATVAALFGGCRSQVSYVAANGTGAGGHYVFIDGSHSSSATSASGMPDAGHDALPDYTDPGCPDAGPALEQFACDPYHQDNGDCMPGEACQIFVQYPQEQCGKEIYGSMCVPAGTGVQGDPCGGGQTCAGGFTCVITGSGTQCVRLCHLDGPSGCPDGEVCEPIDVKGFGGCL